jgi:hypothetical protein
MTTAESLTITNTRICRFYVENPHIHFEAVNLIFIDLFDELLRDVNATMTATMQSQILSSVNQNTQKINDLTSSISFLSDKLTAMHKDILQSFTLRIQELKREYVQELTALLNHNTSTGIDNLLDKHNAALIQKTTSILQDILPRSQTHYYGQIKEVLSGYHKSISEDTRALLKHMDSPTVALKDYLTNFEMKSSVMLQNMQQPIYAFITASEERLSNAQNKNSVLQTRLAAELTDALQELRQTLGQSAGLKQMQTILSRLYNTSDVMNYNQLHHGYDTSGSGEMSTFILKRNNLPKIIIQNIDVERNVTADEIKEFTRIIEQNNCCGIFFSQHGGFVNKPNYHIETHNKLVLLYVHNAEYSSDKIRMSIDILDNVFYKLCDIIQRIEPGSLNSTSIEKEVLEEINKEYQAFILQKDAMMNVVRDTQKTLMSHIDDLKFVALDKYLASKFAVSSNRPGFKCDLCKSFLANNLKALAAHKRGCNRKIAASNNA